MVEIPVPPIDPDPPEHTAASRLLLPWFSHRRVEQYEPFTRELCTRLIDQFIDAGTADAAADYAQQIPVRVIALILGVPAGLSDTFTGWVRDVLEFAHDQVRSNAGRDGIVAYLLEQMEIRRTNPGDDLISELLHTEVDGQPLPDLQVMGVARSPSSPVSTPPGRASAPRCGTSPPTLPTGSGWSTSPS